LWAGKLASLKKIRVAILDDHPSIIDGYIFRLGKADDIEVVATALFVDELENILKSKKTDVLILDVFVPSSKYNSNP
jgi:DNA-binding NarL/FixJ family response regulator